MPRVSEEKVNQILELASQGLSPSEIAKKLRLSERTVKQILQEYSGVLDLDDFANEIRDLDAEQKLTKQLYSTADRTVARVINRAVTNIVEALIRSGIAMGIQLMDKYKWIAQTYGYDKPDKFVEDAIQFYINYYPVVLYIYDRLDQIEKIYLATLTSVQQLIYLLSSIYYNTIMQIIDGIATGKIPPYEGLELIKEIHKFVYDAIDRITGRPIQEVIGESTKPRDSNSRSTSESVGGNREDNSSGGSQEAHNDKSTTTS